MLVDNSRQHLAQTPNRFDESVLARIVEARQSFKFLPAFFITDSEVGAMIWVFCAFLAMIGPIFPLAAIHEGWWPVKNHHVSLKHQTAIYSLLIFSGFCFVLGTLLFHRSFKQPRVRALFSWVYLNSDELHGLWWMFLGTLPYISITAIYTYYNQTRGQFGFALALSLIANFLVELCLVNSYVTMRINANRQTPVKVALLAPFVDSNIPNSIVYWSCLILSVMAFITCMGLMIHFAVEDDKRGIFDFCLGMGISLVFGLGCLYHIAGDHGVKFFDDEEAAVGHSIDPASQNAQLSLGSAAAKKYSADGGDDSKPQFGMPFGRLEIESEDDEDIPANSPPILLSASRQGVDSIPRPSNPRDSGVHQASEFTL